LVGIGSSKLEVVLVIAPGATCEGPSIGLARAAVGGAAPSQLGSRPAVQAAWASGGRAAGVHLHGRQRFGDGAQQLLDDALVDLADVADAEALGEGQLAGVDDELALFQLVVEALELEVGVLGAEEGGDDRRQPTVLQ